MSLLDEIKLRWTSFATAKWRTETDAVNGVIVPTGIYDDTSRRWVVHPEHGICYGASSFTKEHIEQKAEAITAAPGDVLTLIKAIEFLSGSRPEAIEFALQHARKQRAIELGEIKTDVTLRDYR